MVNEIIKGISIALNAAFGDGYEVYQRDVTQNLKPPCFLILMLHSQRTAQSGRRSRQINSFDVQFFPSDVTDNAELYHIGGIILDALAWIVTLDGQQLRGVDRRYEIVNGVLHFFVNYNIFTEAKDDLVPMTTLKLRQI